MNITITQNFHANVVCKTVNLGRWSARGISSRSESEWPQVYGPNTLSGYLILQLNFISLNSLNIITLWDGGLLQKDSLLFQDFFASTRHYCVEKANFLLLNCKTGQHEEVKCIWDYKKGELRDGGLR